MPYTVAGSYSTPSGKADQKASLRPCTAEYAVTAHPKAMTEAHCQILSRFAEFMLPCVLSPNASFCSARSNTMRAQRASENARLQQVPLGPCYVCAPPAGG